MKTMLAAHACDRDLCRGPLPLGRLQHHEGRTARIIQKGRPEDRKTPRKKKSVASRAARRRRSSPGPAESRCCASSRMRAWQCPDRQGRIAETMAGFRQASPDTQMPMPRCTPPNAFSPAGSTSPRCSCSWLSASSAASAARRSASSSRRRPSASACRTWKPRSETPLLYRHTRGVDLTPAGESLLHHARSVLFSLEKMQGELSEYADGVRGHVRMHANISAIVQFLPEDLGAFTRASTRR